VLVLGMIEILPPLGKYKYDTWRILPVKCYIDNSVVAESLKDRIDTAATNGVYWGTRSTLVVILSDFLELESELELLGSWWNADLTDDQADALWPRVSGALDSLASLVPSSFAHNPLDDAGE
jgi:hypothetical protein